MKVVSLPLELCAGVDLAGAHLGNGHLNIVHPLHHLGVSTSNMSTHCSMHCFALPCIIDLPDEGVVFLPERHLGLVVGPSAAKALSLQIRRQETNVTWSCLQGAQ